VAGPMKFKTPSGIDFEIPDDWWSFAEMNDFSVCRTTYTHGRPESYPEEIETREVSLDEIEPPMRAQGIAQFHKSRMLPILLAFRFPGCALPPVQVRLKIPSGRYRFKVYDGFHRYYASVAAGFTHLPVTVLEEGGAMKRGKLSKQEIAAGLRKLDGWSVVKGNLHRIFEFKDFTLAFGFMKRVARAADRMDHHPDWSNSFNKVTIDLSTHSAGGITKNDFALAGKIQKIHGR